MIYIVATYSPVKYHAAVNVCYDVKDLKLKISKIPEGNVIKIENFDSDTEPKKIEFISDLMKYNPRISRKIIDKLLNCQVTFNEKEFFLWSLPSKLYMSACCSKDHYLSITSSGTVSGWNGSTLVVDLYLDNDLDIKFSIEHTVKKTSGGKSVHITERYKLHMNVSDCI